MPRLNRPCQAIAGVGSGPCSIDNVEVSRVGGVASWLTDDIAIYQTYRDGRWIVETLNVRTGEVREVAPHGANELGAGGGKFVGFLERVGLFGEMTLPQGGVSLAFADGRGAVGPDGTVAYVPVRQDGIPTILRAPDGSETTINAVAYGLQVLGPDRAIWNGGSIGLDPAPAMRSGESNRRIVTLPSESWVVSWCEGLGLIAHLYGDATRGFVIQSQPIAFNHDAARLLETDVLVVAYSTSAAELPGQTVVERFDAARRAALMRTFEEAPPPPVDEPIDPDEEHPMFEITEELRDQRETVIESRNSLFPPDKFITDGDEIASWSKDIAKRLKQKYPHLPIGLARAKPGSTNHGGPTAGVPEGFTTDVIAISNGVHWDFKSDGGINPFWNLEADEDNYPPIAARFVPIEDIVDIGGGDNSDNGDEDDDDDEQPPVAVCNCAAELATLDARLAVLEARPWPSPPPAGESFDPALYIARGEVSIDVPWFGEQRKTVTLPIIRKP